MKLMRLAICVAAFAVVGGIAVSEDMDIKALQAKLAAQEARLNDLQAKMGSGKAETPANIISMRKNAKVTIGGLVDTRYYYRDGKVESDVTGRDIGGNRGGVRKVRDIKTGSLEMANAKLAVKIDVNEHMDAYLRLDFLDAHRRADVSGLAQYYWVRWKNICNTGFGVLIGRDDLKFGMGKPVGVIDAYNQDPGPASIMGSIPAAGPGEGMFMNGNLLPTHVSYGQSRTTQINPYWENACKTFKAELSLFQSVDRLTGTSDRAATFQRDGIEHDRSINYGLGSGTLRLTWKPTEELTFVAGAINMHANTNEFRPYQARSHQYVNALTSDRFNKNDFAYHVGVKWAPKIMCRTLTLWANVTQEWNAGWVDDMDVIATNFGAMYEFTDKLNLFAQGDYIYAKNKGGNTWYKADGWRSYVGGQYKLGGGAVLEAGWLHDAIDYKNRAGYKHTKYRGDTLYANLRFTF